MRIDVEGDLGALVSCQILHRLDVHARQQQVRNVSMPQDVGSDFKIDGVGLAIVFSSISCLSSLTDDGGEEQQFRK